MSPYTPHASDAPDHTQCYFGFFPTAGGTPGSVGTGVTEFGTPTKASLSNDNCAGTSYSTSGSINSQVGLRTSNFNLRVKGRTECRFRIKFIDVTNVRIFAGVTNAGTAAPIASGSENPGLPSALVRFSTAAGDTSIKLITNTTVTDTGVTPTAGDMFDFLTVSDGTTTILTTQKVTTGTTGGDPSGAAVITNVTTGSLALGNAVFYIAQIEALSAAVKAFGFYRMLTTSPSGGFVV